MKKRVYLVLVFFAFVLFLQTNSAKALEFNCTNESKVIWDEKEIKLYDSKYVNGMGIGLTYSAEMRAISGGSIVDRFVADLIIDAGQISFSAENSPEDLILKGGTYSIKVQNASETSAKITIGDEEKEIPENNLSVIGGLNVVLVSSDSTPSVKILAGVKTLSLSSNEKAYEKFSFDSKAHFIEIKSASGSDALIRISKCESGDIDVVKTIEEVTEETNEPNQTITNSSANETEERNESDRQVTVAEIRERNRLLQEANKTKNESQENNGEAKRGFFSRLISWIKRLFS